VLFRAKINEPDKKNENDQQSLCSSIDFDIKIMHCIAPSEITANIKKAGSKHRYTMSCS
jgi:hypothetical protein